MALQVEEQESVGQRENGLDGGLDRARYEQGWHSLMAAAPDHAHGYLTYHKQRFYELFDHLAFYLSFYLPENPAPRVLEIGVSPFTKLYKLFFPQLQLVTVDRPLDLYGTEATFTADECGAQAHYSIDLNRAAIGPHIISPRDGEPPLGRFDYVIFAEVLEHLTVNPSQLFGE